MKIVVDIPVAEGVLDAAAYARLRKDLIEAAVFRLFDERTISAVEARRQLGLSRVAFMELARQKGVPMHDYTFEDWQEDEMAIEVLRPEIEMNLRDKSGRGLK